MCCLKLFAVFLFIYICLFLRGACCVSLLRDLLLCVVVVCRLQFMLVACCVLFVVYVSSFVVYCLSFVGVCHRLLHVVCSLVRCMFGLGCLCLVC